MKRTPLEKEWARFKKKERKYRMRRLNQKRNKGAFERIVPAGMQNTLASAFQKGFETVYGEGDFLIRKTVSSNRHIKRYRNHAHKLQRQMKGKHIRAFGKRARLSNRTNILLSGAEGGILGLLGIGLPDIPLFIGNILKSLYQIALDFGFDYSAEKERMFALKLIQGGLQTGRRFADLDADLDAFAEAGDLAYSDVDKRDAMKAAANALSDNLLYGKFIQGIPIIGLTGGALNMHCMNRITKYATLKYEKRFLLEQMKKGR